MRAAVLEDAEKLVVRDVPDPRLAPNEVLLRVGAVGLCGTDFHIFRGEGNYNLDEQGRPIPLNVRPQILGHEFCGTVVEVGAQVRDLKAGDRVVVDQGRNCLSYGRERLCEYCSTGDSHQCEFYQEHGITGLQGAMAEYIAVPAVNCIRMPDDLSFEQAALVEPLGCVIHASDMVERSTTRYSFTGPNKIRYVLIIGAGPAGLLFLQLLRNVLGFDGEIFVADVQGHKLELAGRLGGVPIDAGRKDLIAEIRELTGGARAHYLIDACGNAQVFELIPGLIRKQATVLLYGHGHRGKDIGLLNTIQFLEAKLIAPVGASGGFDPDGRSTTYRKAMELIHNGSVDVSCLITHRYRRLEELERALSSDWMQPGYIKGVLISLSEGP